MKLFIYQTVAYLIVILFSLGCSKDSKLKNEQEHFISLTGNAVFSHEIDSLLQLFIRKANCPDCYYEMYINKRDPDETIFSLRASMNYPKGIVNHKELIQDYLATKHPLMYIKYDNVTFFIYTGIEDFIVFDSFKEDEVKWKKNSASTYFEYCWYIKYMNGKFTVYENTWEYPFQKIDFNGVIEFKVPNSK